MATIIENDQNPTVERETVRVERTESDASGWIVAVIILVLIIAGGAWFWMHRSHSGAATQPSESTNINVTLPGGTNSTGDAASAPQMQ